MVVGGDDGEQAAGIDDYTLGGGGATGPDEGLGCLSRAGGSSATTASPLSASARTSSAATIPVRES